MDMAVRQSIDKVQTELAKFPQVGDMKTNHFLVNGMYAREIFIPAKTLYVGKVHKTDHYFVVLAGSTVMTTDDGTQTVDAPALLTVKAGSKRMGIAITDCRFVAFHRTDKTELIDIEEDLTEYEPNSRYNVLNQEIPLKEDL
jgi:hypothetical protein